MLPRGARCVSGRAVPPWLAAPLAVLLLVFFYVVHAFSARGGRALYYSPGARAPAALWTRDHAALLPDAPGVRRALGAVRFEHVNASAADRRTDRLCIGVMLYRRKVAAVWSLLVSLALQRLAFARARGRGTDAAPVRLPHALAVYWLPHDAADASSSASLRALYGLGYDVVRVDEGIAALRARQLEACSAAEGAASASELRGSGAAAEGAGRLPTPPHAYGFALEDLLFRAAPGSCAGGVLMLEDDALAEVGWEERTRAAVAEVALRDPGWRFIKLHEPDTVNKWNAGGIAMALGCFAVVFSVAIVAALKIAPAPAATTPSLLLLAAAVGCFTAAAFGMLWYAGRPSAPCALNPNACVGTTARRGDWDMSPSQAQLFNPHTAHHFGACMSRTPYATTGVCWQIDTAQHACLAPRTAAAYTALSDGAAAGCGALPRVPKPGTDECAIPETGLRGLWGVQLSLFQHGGIVNSAGETTVLRVAEKWDISGETLRAFNNLP